MTVVSNFTPFDFKARDILDEDARSLDRRDAAAHLPGYGGPERGGRGRQVGEDLPCSIRTTSAGSTPADGPDQILQEFTANPSGLIYSSPVYFNGMVYIQGVGDVIKAYALELDPATNTMMLNETPVSEGTTVSGGPGGEGPPVSGFPGEVQSVSADGTSNGDRLVEADVDQNATSGPAILQAYSANNLSTPLYTSTQAGPRDTAGGARSSLPCRRSPTGTSTSAAALNELDAYHGILPPPGSSTSPSLSGNAGVSVRTPAATVLTRERRVRAYAATPAGPLATRIALTGRPPHRRAELRPAPGEAGTNPS